MLKFAIVGFGGLGKLHFRCYPEVKSKVKDEIKLVAICDIEDSAFTSQTATNLGGENTDLDLKNYTLYKNVDDLLEKEELDFVITALPTYLHEEIGVKIMKKGINLFSEKPMAITYEKAENMVRTAKEMGVKLMIGQCCRYEPKHIKLKEFVDSGKFGKVVRAHFERGGTPPMWAWQNWFMDGKRSGGAALDLHVHDVDLVNYIFGMPKAVCSLGTNHVSEHDSMHTLYYYDDAVVTSLVDWSYSQPKISRGIYSYIRFEKASVKSEKGVLTVYPDEGEAYEVPLDSIDDYAAEMIDFVNCIIDDTVSAINPAEETLKSTRIAFAEKLSANIQEKVTL